MLSGALTDVICTIRDPRHRSCGCRTAVRKSARRGQNQDTPLGQHISRKRHTTGIQSGPRREHRKQGRTAAGTENNQSSQLATVALRLQRSRWTGSCDSSFLLRTTLGTGKNATTGTPVEHAACRFQQSTPPGHAARLGSARLGSARLGSARRGAVPRFCLCSDTAVKRVPTPRSPRPPIAR